MNLTTAVENAYSHTILPQYFTDLKTLSAGEKEEKIVSTRIWDVTKGISIDNVPTP